MKINLAVYTAIEGYSWQPGTAIAHENLIKYKSCIGRFPDPSSDILPFGGAFTCCGKVVFYRFHLAPKIDSKGRDALYLVLGECEKGAAEKLDFKYLFATTELSAPRQPFPVALTYIGNPAKQCSADYSSSFRKNFTRCDDLSVLGHLLSNCPNDGMHVRISGSYGSPSISIVYTAPEQTETTDRTQQERNITNPPKTSTLRFSGQEPTTAPARVTVRKDYAAIIIFAALLGMIIGYVIRDKVQFGKIFGHSIKISIEKDGKPQTSPSNPPNTSPSTPTEKNRSVPHSAVPQHSDGIRQNMCKFCNGRGVVQNTYPCSNQSPSCRKCKGKGSFMIAEPCRQCANTPSETRSHPSPKEGPERAPVGRDEAMSDVPPREKLP